MSADIAHRRFTAASASMRRAAGLFMPPLTPTKLRLLRDHLKAAQTDLGAAIILAGALEPERPFIPTSADDVVVNLLPRAAERGAGGPRSGGGGAARANGRSVRA